MQILYVNHDGGGFAEKKTVTDGETLGTFFNAEMPNAHAEDYLIRVNRQPATAEQVLVNGDRVTVTPVKIEGASSTPNPVEDLDEDADEEEDEDDEEEGEDEFEG
jgi:hypothetical protein